MKERKWIEAAGIRAMKTLAQTAVATIGTAAVLEAVDWRMVLSASVLSAILSLLTSIAGLPEVQPNDRDDIELKADDVTPEMERKAAEIAAQADDEGELKEGAKNE
ncbi:holin [Eubacterium pyruvativorans]|uniref:holin n=1 Tax=Eubacterium pyruvativorans TaxID=155865 RepID=UPI00088A04A2|nr:phage r1t holin [Eubacterium pyruvativorans]